MTDIDPTTSVHTALIGVMRRVQSIRKEGFNSGQGFNFRGIDAVMSAVGPALREEGVIVLPEAVACESESYSTRGNTVMRRVTLTVRFMFIGPDGSTLTCTTMGEASDSGDKAVSKAHSVAFRTALLQSLCVPTDEPDPDESSHERVVEKSAAEVLGWPSTEAQAEAFDSLRSSTRSLPDEAAEPVKAWLTETGLTRSTLTPALSEAWAERIVAATQPAPPPPLPEPTLLGEA